MAKIMHEKRKRGRPPKIPIEQDAPEHADDRKIIPDNDKITQPNPSPWTPAMVTQTQQAQALRNVARVVPPSARVKIERLTPAWCRGYLETTDGDAINDIGLEEYLLQHWGGERYRITVVNEHGAELWHAADISICGTPRQHGISLDVPKSLPPIQYPIMQPQPSNGDGQIAKLAEAIGMLARQQEAIIRHLANPPAVQAPAPAKPVNLMDSIREAVQIRDAIDEFIPRHDAEPDKPAQSPLAIEAQRMLMQALFKSDKTPAESPPRPNAPSTPPRVDDAPIPVPDSDPV